MSLPTGQEEYCGLSEMIDELTSPTPYFSAIERDLLKCLANSTGSGSNIPASSDFLFDFRLSKLIIEGWKVLQNHSVISGIYRH